MTTLIGTQRDPATLLAALIALDYDAIAAYQVAIDRLEHRECRERFKQFRADHERHVRDLGHLLRSMNVEPPSGADIKQILTAGRVLLSDIVGGDRAILEAMMTNEEESNCAYENAASHCDLPGTIRLTIERHLADERTHRAWIEDRALAFERLEKDEDAAARGGDWQPQTDVMA